MLSTGCTDTKMERLNWIALESSADLHQNLQSSASDNKPGVIQHLLVWLRALARGRYIDISPPLASAEVCRHQASQRIHCMRSKPPQLLPIHRSFDPDQCYDDRHHVLYSLACTAPTHDTLLYRDKTVESEILQR